MTQVFLAVRHFWRDEVGVTSIEYALVASLIAIAIVVGVSLLAVQVGNLYSRISDCVVNLGCP